MPIRRDPRTTRWFFRAIVKLPDGTRHRLFGTPGIPGRYADLAQTKVGAQEAERRAVAEAMAGKRAVQPEPREVQETEPRKEVPTVQQYAEAFLEKYTANHKPSERRSKRQILRAHVLKFFGHLRLDQIRQEDVDAFVAAERNGVRPRRSITALPCSRACSGTRRKTASSRSRPCGARSPG